MQEIGRAWRNMEARDVWNQFDRMVSSPDEEIDLSRAALLIAATEYSNLSIERELFHLDGIAEGIAPRMEDDTPLYQLNTLSEYLFDELKFAGNHTNYHDPRNSFLNDVMERKRGIPITLSLLYIEVGKRIGVPLLGIGMPGHFIVRHRDEPEVFVDPFHGGILLSVDECMERLKQVTQGSLEWDADYLEPVSSRAIIARMLRNLKLVYLQRRNYERVLATIDRVIALLPQDAVEFRDRGVVNYRLGNFEEALEDLHVYVASGEEMPDGVTVHKLMDQIRDRLEE
ncbi:MAG: transglutaminase-like domain-containing protein [Chloroflexi bacterium]|nr:transglutaminase-like domain-containing protein [Chloroflexota bacterium]